MKYKLFVCFALYSISYSLKSLTLPLTRNYNYFSHGDQVIVSKENAYTISLELGYGRKTQNVVIDSITNQHIVYNQTCLYPTVRKFYSYENGFICNEFDGCITINKQLQQTFQHCPPTDFCSVQGDSISLNVGFNHLLNSYNSTIMIVYNEDINVKKGDGNLGLGFKSSIDQPFVTKLKGLDIIDDEMFSFHIGLDIQDEQIVFGGFNSKLIANPSQIYYHKVIAQADSWKLQIKQFKIQDTQFKLENKLAIIDTKESSIMFDKQTFEFIKGYINKLCPDFNNCTQDLPDWEFTFTDTDGIDRVYTIPKSYQLDSGCYNTTSDAIILGLPFFKKYTSMFISSNQTIGKWIYQYYFSMLRQIFVFKGFSLTGYNEYSDQGGLQIWVIVIIVIGVLILLGISGYFLYKYFKKKREQKKAILNEQILDNTKSDVQFLDSQFLDNENNLQYEPPNQNQLVDQNKPIQQYIKKKDKYNQRTF